MKYLIFSVVMVLAQYSMAQMRPPAQPAYETCSQPTAPTANVEGQVDPSAEAAYQASSQAYQECLNRNAIKQRDYNAAVDAYNRGTRIITSDSGGMTQPVAPQYESCGNQANADGMQVYDYACHARNQAKQREYNIQMSGYNEARQQQQAAEQARTAEQQRLAAQQQLASARAAAQSAQKKNEEANTIYQLAAMSCSITSGYYAGAFAASCAGAGVTCQWPLLARSIAFAIFSGLASKQADSHNNVAYEACVTASKVSASAGNCGGPPAPYDVNTDLGSLYDSEGRCIGNPSACNKIARDLPVGTNIKDALKGRSTFATSKAPFKINPDGSVTTKDGKKFTADNFSSESAMVAAGISAAEAKSLLASLKKNSSAEAGAGATKDALAKQNKFDPATYAESGGAGLGKTGDLKLNGRANGFGKDLDGSGKRDVASAEGLAKDFNGELIGVSGDDIFKMMNRRYKLKTAQDNFIAP